MSANSKIEWCDHTFNPWIGCTKVSPGCANCYAEASDKFRSWTPEGWGKGKPRKRTSESYWKQPLKWNASRTDAATKQRVFCASLADWLDDEVPIEWLSDLLALIHATPNLDWLLLTKRPENFGPRSAQCTESKFASMRVAAEWRVGYAPENVWLGVSVEDQKRADERIPALLKIPARVRFLSCEPLLGPIDLSEYFRGIFWPESHRWVIVGGESGSRARPMHPHWARSLRDQCVTSGVPFFFKQWGEFSPGNSLRNSSDILMSNLYINGIDDMVAMQRVGKKRAGRLLDGREWNEFPSPRTQDALIEQRTNITPGLALAS